MSVKSTSVLVGLFCVASVCLALQASPASVSDKVALRQSPAFSQSQQIMRLRGGGKAVAKKEGAPAHSILATLCAFVNTRTVVATIAIAALWKKFGPHKHAEPVKVKAPEPVKESGLLGLGCCGL